MKKSISILLISILLFFLIVTCDILNHMGYKITNSSSSSSYTDLKQAEVTDLKAEKTYRDGEIRCNGEIKLSWAEPTDDRLQHIEITAAPAINGIENPLIIKVKPHDTNGTAYFSKIVNGIKYTFTVKTVYYPNDTKSVGNSVEIIGEDIMPPVIDTDIIFTISGRNEVTIYNVNGNYNSYDADRSEITYEPQVNGIDQPILMDIDRNNHTPFVLSGLTIETEYTFTIKILDTSDNRSDPYTIRAKPSAPPSEVTNLVATAGDKKVTLTWDDPPEADFTNIYIYVYYTGNPIAIDSQWKSINKGVETLEITGLTNDYSYDFQLRTVDDNDSISDGVTISCTPYMIN